MSLKIELEVHEVQAVLAGLAKLPLENSIDAWFKVKNQAEAQMEQQRSAEPQSSGQEPAPQA